MTEGAVRPFGPIGPTHPLVTSLTGAAAHAVVMTFGYGYDIGYAAYAAAGAVVAALLGMWAWAGSSVRLERTSLGLGIASAVAVSAWWTGWPLVLGLTAAGLALEDRRRTGSFSAITGVGLVIGLLAFGAAAVACLTGSDTSPSSAPPMADQQ